MTKNSGSNIDSSGIVKVRKSSYHNDEYSFEQTHNFYQNFQDCLGTSDIAYRGGRKKLNSKRVGSDSNKPKFEFFGSPDSQISKSSRTRKKRNVINGANDVKNALKSSKLSLLSQ